MWLDATLFHDAGHERYPCDINVRGVFSLVILLSAAGVYHCRPAQLQGSADIALMSGADDGVSVERRGPWCKPKKSCFLTITSIIIRDHKSIVSIIVVTVFN